MQLPGHAVRSAPAVSFMEPSLLISRSTIFVFLLLVWCCAACRKDDPPPEFPQKFTIKEKNPLGAGRAYWMNPDGAWIPLALQKSGTFSTFLDTIGGYAWQYTTPLDFTGIELLNAYQVRIFSDGSVGIPPLDTVVRYTSTSNHIMTVSWTPHTAPLTFLTDEWFDGRLYLRVYSHWFTYSYRPTASPDTLQYTPLRHYYSGNDLQKQKIIADDGLGHGDTLAVYTRTFLFMQ